MAGGYSHNPDGMDGLAAMIANLQRQIDALRATAGLTSAVIGKGGVTVKDGGRITTTDATGAQIQLGQGRIAIWQDAVTSPDAFGLIYCDPLSGSSNYLRIFPPYDSGTGLENRVTIQGRTATAPGNFWVYTDGQGLINSGGDTFIDSGGDTFINSGGDTYLRADGIVYLGSGLTDSVRSNIIAGATTSNASNVYIDPTTAAFARSTSSLRYKTDVEPLPLAVDAILGVDPVRFHDKGEVERYAAGATDTIEVPVLTKSGRQSIKDGLPVREKIEVPVPKPSWIPGITAEQLHDAGLGVFVTYDDQDRPDAVSYDRLIAAVIPLLRQHHERVATLEAANLDLTARLEALETDR